MSWGGSWVARNLGVAAKFVASSRQPPQQRAPLDVLYVVIDNLRPDLASFGNPQAVTPTVDRLAESGVACTRTFTQFAWCSPSRNSFLSGRRPDATAAWNFRDSFRNGTAEGQNMVTLPGWFKKAGFYVTGTGKVFHPDLPANNDFPQSWSDESFAPSKLQCPHRRMTCNYGPEESETFDVDSAATNESLARLEAWLTKASVPPPLFLALGLQGPRLPWSYSDAAAEQLAPVEDFPVPQAMDDQKSAVRTRLHSGMHLSGLGPRRWTYIPTFT